VASVHSAHYPQGQRPLTETVNIDHSLRKGLRVFLRQIVADATAKAATIPETLTASATECEGVR
jgi:hypothetical protein